MKKIRIIITAEVSDDFDEISEDFEQEIEQLLSPNGIYMLELFEEEINF